MEQILLEPVVQYGFLGFSAVLLGLIRWLVGRLLTVLEENNKVIAANTAAIDRLSATTADLLQVNRSLHDKVIARPCIGIREAV